MNTYSIIVRNVLTALTIAGCCHLHAQKITTRFEMSGGKETPTYQEIISWWQKLDAQFPQVNMKPMGPSDAGLPLHLVTISNDRDFNFESLRRKNKRIILINNGIHPGEPDGIDASMLLARDIVTGKMKLPDNVVLAIIPVYNIGGCLNRSKYYRVDQNGPDEFGSRGNSQNLDLNRDFIKCDSKEARSFVQIFHMCDPDILVDNHVSDGADYQPVMTLISSQHNKLGGVMGDYQHSVLVPALRAQMKQKGFDLLPYVNVFNESPENGWSDYLDLPRYSSGYASLWHTFAFVPETHMLKPYRQRVEATYALMQCFIDFTAKNSDAIMKLRGDTKRSVATAKTFELNWRLDSTRFSELLFRGYEAVQRTSAVSGKPMLFFDRSRPYEKKVRIYDEFAPSETVQTPLAYIIPQGWWKVIDLLKINNIQMKTLTKDTTIEVEVYHITAYKSAARQYEMHHLNSDVKLNTTREKIHFRKGDWYIALNQTGNRFIVETLEPQAPDSYFAWNYFDAILGQKEGISEYVFDEKAVEMLKASPELQQQLNEKKGHDSAFAANTSAQLNFVFEHSPYFEPEYLRYPVFRVTR